MMTLTDRQSTIPAVMVTRLISCTSVSALFSRCCCFCPSSPSSSLSSSTSSLTSSSTSPADDCTRSRGRLSPVLETLSSWLTNLAPARHDLDVIRPNNHTTEGYLKLHWLWWSNDTSGYHWNGTTLQVRQSPRGLWEYLGILLEWYNDAGWPSRQALWRYLEILLEGYNAAG